jgi:AraC-like DNA-binding protein
MGITATHLRDESASSASTTVSRSTLPKLHAAMEFIEGNFKRSPNLDEIAQAAGLSPFHLHRQFSKHFGKTIKQAVTELQMEEVKRLLTNGARLREAAAAAGFAHQWHLSMRFKQINGVPPRTWLRQVRETQLQNAN